MFIRVSYNLLENSDEYVNIVLTAVGCYIEISARNPIANSEYVSAALKLHIGIVKGAAGERAVPLS